MTFRIANNQIHIGWPQTLSVIGVIIGFAWGARAYYDGFLQDRAETNRRLAGIERQLSIKNSTDSIQTSVIGKLTSKVDSLGRTIGLTDRSSKPKLRGSIRFYSERRVNGRTELTEIKQD